MMNPINNNSYWFIIVSLLNMVETYVNSDETDLERHIINVHNFVCEYPQPRLINVKKHFDDPSKTYYPTYTVLHRCANDTGFCGKNSYCMMDKSEEIELIFFAQNPNKTREYRRIKFNNHTLCKCYIND